MTEAQEFLDGLFGAKPKELFILIWELPGRKSYWTPDVVQAAQYAETLAEWHDVYVGAGLAARDPGPTKRAEAKDVAAIPGLWSDIDYAGPGHTQKNLPPGPNEARQLISMFPLPPNLVVDSGGGFNCW